MDYNPISSLIDPALKGCIANTLHKCNLYKQQYYSSIYNGIALVVFVVLVGGLIYANRHTPLTLEEKQHRDAEKYNYVMSRIQNFNTNKLKEQQALITGLPQWVNP